VVARYAPYFWLVFWDSSLLQTGRGRQAGSRKTLRPAPASPSPSSRLPLGVAAEQAYQAAEKHDAKAIAAVGERLDDICSACHKHYGYE